MAMDIRHVSSGDLPSVRGLHHLTALAGDPQETLDFYAGTLGLRLVKRSVNQDAPDTYPLFYADAVGTPGTDITFFPKPGLQRGPRGAGQIVEVAFAVSDESFAYWTERLGAHGVSTSEVEQRFGARTLPLKDPSGMRLALVAVDRPQEVALWAESPVPAENQLRGMHAIRIWERSLGPTERVLTEVLGLQKIGIDGGWHRYGLKEDTGEGMSGTLAEVKEVTDAAPGRSGAGTIHHAAWRTRSTDEEKALRAALQNAGLRPSSLIDRFWFTSVYAREPGGVLFELARRRRVRGSPRGNPRSSALARRPPRDHRGGSS